MWKSTTLESLYFSSFGLQLLQEGVSLALGGFHTVRPHDARRPVPVEHEDKLLPLMLQLLDLRFELRVHHLQPLRLLRPQFQDDY